MSEEPIEVLVMSMEAAEDQVAELWVGGVQLGETLMRDGTVVLRIEPRSDGRPWEVGATALRHALSRAAELLGSR
jgi:hypothetical protein